MEVCPNVRAYRRGNEYKLSEAITTSLSTGWGNTLVKYHSRYIMKKIQIRFIVNHIFAAVEKVNIVSSLKGVAKMGRYRNRVGAKGKPARFAVSKYLPEVTTLKSSFTPTYISEISPLPINVAAV